MDFDFVDSGGRWTPQKQRRATEEIYQLCRERNITDQPTITFEEPERLPSRDNAPLFAYRYSAVFPD